jgi:hypothetical protein
MAQEGAVIRSSDGSMYFIRQEILEACRVQPDEVDDTQRMLDESEGEVSGFAFSTGPILSVTPVQLNNPAGAQTNLQSQLANFNPGKSMSTVMCCW